jgi:TPR repeat protein
MRIRGFGILLLAGAVCIGAASRAHAFAYEPPGRFLPGAYFEYKAQFYLRNRQYRAALQMFELAGYWANKVAQYNVGIMYFNGIGGIGRDRVRGTAWLGIAAEQHHELADGALQAAWAELTPGEREVAEGIFRELDAKYGDAVALPRATRHYADEARQVTGSRTGLVGNIRITDAENPLRMGNEYYAEQEHLANLYVSRFGHAAVGEVRPLPVPDEDKSGASQKALVAPAKKAQSDKPD